MNDFKYPLLQSFFDSDGVSCIFVDELIKLYPKIEDLTIDYKLPNNTHQGSRDFNSFGWSLSNKLVMTSSDAEQFIRLYKKIIERCDEENITIYEVDFMDIGVCNVCDELLFPDDDLYSDEDTYVALCDNHSAYNEDSGNYFKYDDSKLFIEGCKIHNLDRVELKYIENENSFDIYYKTFLIGEVEKNYTKDSYNVTINNNRIVKEEFEDYNLFELN